MCRTYENRNEWKGNKRRITVKSYEFSLQRVCDSFRIFPSFNMKCWILYMNMRADILINLFWSWQFNLYTKSLSARFMWFCELKKMSKFFPPIFMGKYAYVYYIQSTAYLVENCQITINCKAYILNWTTSIEDISICDFSVWIMFANCKHYHYLLLKMPWNSNQTTSLKIQINGLNGLIHLQWLQCDHTSIYGFIVSTILLPPANICSGSQQPFNCVLCLVFTYFILRFVFFFFGSFFLFLLAREFIYIRIIWIQLFTHVFLLFRFEFSFEQIFGIVCVIVLDRK